MSTRITLRSRPRSNAHAGYHLYLDCIDEWLGDTAQVPVYLQLDGSRWRSRLWTTVARLLR